MLRILQVVSLLLLLPSGLPNFSGYWQLDKPRSQVSASTSTMWMRIEHSENSLLITLRSFQQKGGEENQTFVYAIGSTGNHNT
ncbi:MAG: hypothetical protein ACR2IF_08830 [Terriglobales bacterium]